MNLDGLPLEKISAALIEELCSSSAPETRTLEFKRQPYGKSDSGRDEFLKDVSSIANTDGGHLILGVAEADGRANTVMPIAENIAMEHAARLVDIASTGLRPRISLTPHLVPMGGGAVLVIRIDQCLDPPVQIVTGKANGKIFLRESTRAVEADVDQLRAMYQRGPDLFEKMASFRRERAKVLLSRRPLPLKLTDADSLLVHVIPRSSFIYGADVSGAFATLMNSNDGIRLAPVAFTGASQRALTYLGMLGLTELIGYQNHSAYALLFRNGIVEGAYSGYLRQSGDDVVPLPWLEDHIKTSARKYMTLLSTIGVPPPYVVFATLVGLAKAVPFFRETPIWDRRPPLGEDIVELAESIVKPWPMVQTPPGSR